MLFDDEFGLTDRATLLRAGLTKRAIDANVAAHRWQRVFHGVYANFTGPLDRPTLLRAAVLHAGYPATLSHHTAAEVWGFARLEPDEQIHLTVPYGHSVRSRSDRIALHRSRAFQHIIVVRDPVPITGRADTVIDVAVAEHDPDAARQRFLALAGPSGINPYTFHDRLLARPPRRYRPEIDEAVSMLKQGICSALEERYFELVERAHGLPAGHRQHEFAVNGMTLWEDLVYDNVGVELTVRLDGREYHSQRGVLFRDRARDNAAELAGRARLVYGWHDVIRNPCGVAGEVAAVLRRGGLPIDIARCPRCSAPVST